MEKIVHAQVLPSFFLKHLKRNIYSTKIEVTIAELMDWTRDALPDRQEAAAIRSEAIARARGKFEKIWESKIGIPDKEGFLQYLYHSERNDMEAIIAEQPGNTFVDMTLRQLKKRLAIPVDQVLSRLARMEAVDWDPVLSERAIKAQTELTEEQKASAMQLLSLPWVDAIKLDDVRFPGKFGQPLPARIAFELKMPRVEPWVADAIDRLGKASRMTVSEEIVDLAMGAMQGRRQGEEDKKRWAHIFGRRYAVGDGQSLQEVGDEQGVTRERIRQVCDQMLNALKKRPRVTPALAGILADVALVTPKSEDDINTEFAAQLGAVSISGAIDFAATLEIPNIPIRRTDVNSRQSGGYSLVSMIETESDEVWMQKGLSYARADCSMMGCSNLFRVAGLLAIRDEVAPGKASIESLLSQVPGYRVLDAKAGWFTTEAGNTSAAATRLQKILHVATEPVNVDSIAEAFITSSNWLDRDDDRAFSFPPVHVMRDLFSGWDWVLTIQYNRFTPRTPIPKGILSDSEEVAVAIARKHGGVILRHELVSELTADPYNVSAMSVSIMLASSPVMQKLEHGTYMLRGCGLDPLALKNARDRNTLLRRPDLPVMVPGETLSIPMHHSGSSPNMRRRAVYTPAVYMPQVLGYFTSEKYRSITVTRTGQINNLAETLDSLGIEPKGPFSLKINLESRTFDIERSPEAPTPEGTDLKL